VTVTQFMSAQYMSARKMSGAIALAVVVVDQITKHWALNRLSDGRMIDVVGSLRFNLSFNRGMAFSQGEGLGPIIAIVGVVVVAYLLISFRRNTRSGTALVGLIAGGAAGNIVDRAFRGDAWLRGAVVDFVDLQWWPIFNVADAAICVGGALLVLSSLRGDKSETETT